MVNGLIGINGLVAPSVVEMVSSKGFVNVLNLFTMGLDVIQLTVKILVQANVLLI